MLPSPGCKVSLRERSLHRGATAWVRAAAGTRDLVGGLPRAFWYLWTGTLINRLGSFVLVFMAIYLTQERGFSDARAGLVIGLWGAGGAVGSLLGGVPRRPLGTPAHPAHRPPRGRDPDGRHGLRPRPADVAGCALLLGLFAEAARPAFSAMMIDVVPERDRVRAFSLNYWAVNVGFAAAAILGRFRRPDRLPAALPDQRGNHRDHRR